MKSTYLSLTLALPTLAFPTSCGPDALKSEVEVADLSFKTTTATLQPSTALQPVATITPSSAKVTSTSDNTAVATISETRLVRVTVSGAATITAQAGDERTTRVITIAEAKSVAIFNKLDGQKYPSRNTIDYVATIPEEKTRNYDPELSFNVSRTEQYSGSMTLDTPVDGRVCLGNQCKPAKNLPLFTAKITLTSDDEGVDSDEHGRKKREMIPLNIYIKLNIRVGETYKNRMAIEFAPLTGEGETLKWAINPATIVKQDVLIISRYKHKVRSNYLTTSHSNYRSTSTATTDQVQGSTKQCSQHERAKQQGQALYHLILCHLA